MGQGAIIWPFSARPGLTQGPRRFAGRDRAGLCGEPTIETLSPHSKAWKPLHCVANSISQQPYVDSDNLRSSTCILFHM